MALLIGEPLLFLGSEAVQQEDGVIHRHCQLNDRRDTMGEEGDLPKDDIGAHVEDNGEAMVSRNSTGSNQEVVVIASTAKITTTPAAMIIGISREILSSRVLFSMAGPL